VKYDRLGQLIDADLFARSRLALRSDVHQRTVLQSAAPRGLLNCTRQWGKSTVTAAKAVHHAVAYPGALVLVVSPTARQSGEFVLKAAGFLNRLGIRRRGDGLNEISLLLPNDSRIVGLPGKEDNIRGFSRPGLILIDEAARVPDEMYAAVSPMLATCDGPMWLMSTPAGKRGYFYEAWSGAKGAAWTRISVKAPDCPRISRAFLDRERQTMNDRMYRQEFLCESLEADGQLIRDDFLDDAIRRDVRPLDLEKRYFR
jgi:hypothetical protein